jgi:hypothetical protein
VGNDAEPGRIRHVLFLVTGFGPVEGKGGSGANRGPFCFALPDAVAMRQDRDHIE